MALREGGICKDIPYEVLTAMVQDNVLFVAWQDNILVLRLTTAYNMREIHEENGNDV